jgi:hypothetical protein
LTYNKKFSLRREIAGAVANCLGEMFRRHAVVRRKVVEVAVSDVHRPVPVVEEVFSPWMRLSPQWPNKSARIG